MARVGRAAACPSCGAPVKGKPRTVSTGCGCLIIVVVFIIGASMLSGPRKPAVPPSPEQQARREAQEAAEAERRSANQAVVQENQKKNLDTFMVTLKAGGVDRSIIDSVALRGDTLTVTVANTWHIMAYQIRLQAAQNLWQTWASISSPTDQDRARLKLVDLNGNEVGGSRLLAGSLIWVQEQ